MPDSLADLEARRAAVQMQIAQLGDMRSGSITGTGGRCGNPNCHCHGAGDPGHGPYYRLTRKVKGKTVTETFSSPASLAKAQREVAECQRFRERPKMLPSQRPIRRLLGGTPGSLISTFMSRTHVMVVS